MANTPPAAPPTSPMPTSPPAGSSADSGSWYWNAGTNSWTWRTNARPTDGFLADPAEGGASAFYRWAQSQVGKKYLQFDDQHTWDWYNSNVQKYGDPFYNKESDGGLQFKNPMAMGPQSGLAVGNSLGPSAGQPLPKDNPFGNEMMGYHQQYTPFGLSSGGSAFPSGGGMGGMGGGYSYASDQLVPSLEQRRMGMISQMFHPYGGK